MDDVKELTIGDKKFQLKRMSAETGSWILNVLLSAMFKAVSGEEVSTSDQAEFDKGDKVEKANNAIAAMWVSVGTTVNLETYKQIQRCCLQTCLLYVGGNPLMLISANGRWADAALEKNVLVVNQLITEVLQFNLAPFFIESALKNKPEAATALASS